eukprot:6490404-Amphidinium_carterae.1
MELFLAATELLAAYTETEEEQQRGLYKTAACSCTTTTQQHDLRSLNVNSIKYMSGATSIKSCMDANLKRQRDLFGLMALVPENRHKELQGIPTQNEIMHFADYNCHHPYASSQGSRTVGKALCMDETQKLDGQTKLSPKESKAQRNTTHIRLFIC